MAAGEALVSARDEMLRRVRAAEVPPAGPVPRAYRIEGAFPRGTVEVCDLLVDRLGDYRATVVRCTADEVPAQVAAQLEGLASVVVPDGVPPSWLGRVVAQVRRDEPLLSRRELDAIPAVLTTCRIAIAETGTFVLVGGAGQGRRALSLLPDRHVAVVLADQVVHTVPEAVSELRDAAQRPLTWISGPSATSDIELVRVEGVHGPRDLRVIIVG
jgi:L-lactate dehydrogenase complex protein LldG